VLRTKSLNVDKKMIDIERFNHLALSNLPFGWGTPLKQSVTGVPLHISTLQASIGTKSGIGRGG